jgi:hypothetical protein
MVIWSLIPDYPGDMLIVIMSTNSDASDIAIFKKRLESPRAELSD